MFSKCCCHIWPRFFSFSWLPQLHIYLFCLCRFNRKRNGQIDGMRINNLKVETQSTLHLASAFAFIYSFFLNVAMDFYSISNLQRCFYYICAIFSWLLLAFPFVRPTPLTRFAYFVFSIKLTRFPFSLHFLWPSSGCLHLHLNYIGNRNLKTIRWDFLHLGLSGNFDCGIGLNFPQTRCKNLILFVNDPKELLVKNENREGNMIPCGCKEWKKKKGKAK